MTDPINTDENSYDQYKRYLEDSIGVMNLQPPSKPMNAYLRFFFERSCEERSKGNKEWKKMTETISEEWNKLPGNKKQYYERMYEIRMKERSEIFEEYERLIKKKKPATAWSRFFKKRYSVYALEHPNYNAKEITRLVSSDWRNIPEKEKAKLEKQYEEEKAIYEAKQDNTDRIEEYKARVKSFEEDLNEEKEKIMKKFGVTKQAMEKQKLLKKTQERQKRALESEQRKRLKNEKIKKQKQENAQKEKEAKEKLKKEKEEVLQKEKQKLQEEKLKAKSAEKARPATPKAAVAETPAVVKIEESKPEVSTTRKEKASVKAKPAPKPAQKAAKKPEAKKTKKIQKPAKKAPAVKPSPKSVKKSQAATVKQEPSVSSGKKTAKQSRSSKPALKAAVKKSTTRSGRK